MPERKLLSKKVCGIFLTPHKPLMWASSVTLKKKKKTCGVAQTWVFKQAPMSEVNMFLIWREPLSQHTQGGKKVLRPGHLCFGPCALQSVRQRGINEECQRFAFPRLPLVFPPPLSPTRYGFGFGGLQWLLTSLGLVQTNSKNKMAICHTATICSDTKYNLDVGSRPVRIVV